MKIKPCHVFVAVSLAANMLLAAALGTTHSKIDRHKAETAHMLAQRIAVLDIEQFIQKRQPRRNDVERRGWAELIVDAATEFGRDPRTVARVSAVVVSARSAQSGPRYSVHVLAAPNGV